MTTEFLNVPARQAKRRKQVVRLRDQGMSRAEIAEKLNVSERTVTFDLLAMAGVMRHCQHCDREMPSPGRRGLCHECYGDPEIAEQYRPQTAPRVAEPEPRQFSSAPTKPGEPWGCFWCGQRECSGSFQLCQSCREWYAEAAKDMPAEMGHEVKSRKHERYKDPRKGAHRKKDLANTAEAE